VPKETKARATIADRLFILRVLCLLGVLGALPRVPLALNGTVTQPARARGV
jgi:hypothetical protein